MLNRSTGRFYKAAPTGPAVPRPKTCPCAWSSASGRSLPEVPRAKLEGVARRRCPQAAAAPDESLQAFDRSRLRRHSRQRRSLRLPLHTASLRGASGRLLSQAPQPAGMARRSIRDGPPLHADLVLLAQRRRRLLLQAHPTELETRRLPLGR